MSKRSQFNKKCTGSLKKKMLLCGEKNHFVYYVTSNAAAVVGMCEKNKEHGIQENKRQFSLFIFISFLSKTFFYLQFWDFDLCKWNMKRSVRWA